MTTTTKPNLVQLVRSACQRDDAGRHFTEWLDWHALEEHGLIEIVRPVHAATGMSYDWTRWMFTLTPAAERLASYDWWIAPSEWNQGESRSVISTTELVGDADHMWSGRKLADVLEDGMLIEAESRLDALAKAVRHFGADSIEDRQVQELRDAVSEAIDKADVCCPSDVSDSLWDCIERGDDWRQALDGFKQRDPAERRALGIPQAE